MTVEEAKEFLMDETENIEDRDMTSVTDNNQIQNESTLISYDVLVKNAIKWMDINMWSHIPALTFPNGIMIENDPMEVASLNSGSFITHDSSLKVKETNESSSSKKSTRNDDNQYNYLTYLDDASTTSCSFLTNDYSLRTKPTIDPSIWTSTKRNHDEFHTNNVSEDQTITTLTLETKECNDEEKRQPPTIVQNIVSKFAKEQCLIIRLEAFTDPMNGNDINCRHGNLDSIDFTLPLCAGQIVSEIPSFCRLKKKDRFIGFITNLDENMYYRKIPVSSLIPIPCDLSATIAVAIASCYVPALQIVRHADEFQECTILLIGDFSPLCQAIIHLAKLRLRAKIYILADESDYDLAYRYGTKPIPFDHNDWSLLDGVQMNVIINLSNLGSKSLKLHHLNDISKVIHVKSGLGSAKKNSIDHLFNVDCIPTTFFRDKEQIINYDIGEMWENAHENIKNDFYHVSTLFQEGHIPSYFYNSVGLRKYYSNNRNTGRRIFHVCNPWV